MEMDTLGAVAAIADEESTMYKDFKNAIMEGDVKTPSKDRVRMSTSRLQLIEQFLAVMMRLRLGLYAWDIFQMGPGNKGGTPTKRRGLVMPRSWETILLASAAFPIMLNALSTITVEQETCTHAKVTADVYMGSSSRCLHDKISQFVHYGELPDDAASCSIEIDVCCDVKYGIRASEIAKATILGTCLEEMSDPPNEPLMTPS
ncbi:unnamed protein product [Mytilus edulis]|uniref:Uncharacterized protein n=1 Tax=Mytilus edulis TaxID=6550 RepID=A0A8S3S6X8_MYTED|nr:unnamed protein product [Mytilus edulis]